MVKLMWRAFQNTDLLFFQEVISASGKWRKNELHGAELSHYMNQYEELAGEWRIWEREGSPAAITYHLEAAPSNRKAWIGTVLVKASERRKGIAASILNQLAADLKEKDHRAIFAGVPIDEYEWSNFLSDCGFEQFKSEKNKGETFLIMVRPLV
ncbi:GNAT family N-acetyltransferase [Bacillus sp. JJ1122]|uniref:GNAT family N-acetyltransferase n=1 Tax=Bacillus sp. JJ1122 TaxID=3122951 RepID=UPI002FFDA862